LRRASSRCFYSYSFLLIPIYFIFILLFLFMHAMFSLSNLAQALVEGLDISSDMDDVYALMGACPQHDLLWDGLTGEEALGSAVHAELAAVRGCCGVAAITWPFAGATVDSRESNRGQLFLAYQHSGDCLALDLQGCKAELTSVCPPPGPPGREHLLFYARIKSFSGRRLVRAVHAALHSVNLLGAADELVGGYR
jgi:hypothetical protein